MVIVSAKREGEERMSIWVVRQDNECVGEFNYFKVDDNEIWGWVIGEDKGELLGIYENVEEARKALKKLCVLLEYNEGIFVMPEKGFSYRWVCDVCNEEKSRDEIPIVEEVDGYGQMSICEKCRMEEEELEILVEGLEGLE